MLSRGHAACMRVAVYLCCRERAYCTDLLYDCRNNSGTLTNPPPHYITKYSAILRHRLLLGLHSFQYLCAYLCANAMHFCCSEVRRCWCSKQDAAAAAVQDHYIGAIFKKHTLLLRTTLLPCRTNWCCYPKEYVTGARKQNIVAVQSHPLLLLFCYLCFGCWPLPAHVFYRRDPHFPHILPGSLFRKAHCKLG